MRRVSAAAPSRLDLAGGWTDVEPVASTLGGRVVSVATDRLARVTVLPARDGVAILATDLDLSVQLDERGIVSGEGRLPLLEAFLRRFPITNAVITTVTDTPKGSGLGTSGALGVAMLAALTEARGERRAPEELARLAWEVETREAGIPGGKQDQYIAALGGVQDLTFHRDSVTATPIALDTAFRTELEASLLVCYTGESRLSGNTIARVMRSFAAGDPIVSAAMMQIRDAGKAAAVALQRGDLLALAEAMNSNWVGQRRLDRAMQTPRMARLEAVARDHGALAVKAAGAGAGGSLIVLATPDRVDGVHERLSEAGAEMLRLKIGEGGVRTW